MGILSAKEILEVICISIRDWHNENEHRPDDYVVITKEIRKIKPLKEHRDNLNTVVKELAVTNTEIWHEEDKVRSEKDAVVLKAIRNINPLNQHRNDLIEEIDEIISDLLNQ